MTLVTDAKKREFDVDNPEKVEKIRDHGQSLYHQHNKANRRRIQEPVDSVNNANLIEKIAQELDDALKEDHLDDSKYFIPCAKFHRIISPERVLQVVSILKCFENRTKEEKQRLAQDISFGSSNGLPSRRVFAALIGINKIKDLDKHMSDGLHDSCLPMKCTQVDGKFRLKCNINGHAHNELNNLSRRHKIKQFMEWTRYFMAPYITSSEGLHPHYILDSGNCLPMKIVEKVPNNPEANTSQDGGYGGFSEVYKVMIYEGHCNLEPTRPMRHPRGYFALKKLTSHDRELFKLELQSLLFSADQKGNNNKHMIQVLATFEERNRNNSHATFYLLFDWADGDLEYFWKKNNQLVRNMEHSYWMADQFLGLAKALQTIHNDRLETLPLLPVGVSDSNLYGRHGDIKPANMLWFKGGLALADFGLGRLHSKLSRSKQDPSALAKTATYRAPEFDLPRGLIGPTSDVYSLGCVYLEYISWFLLGHDGIEEFAKKREGKDKHGFDTDEFFTIKVSASGQQQSAVIKPKVREWIKGLKSHYCCSWYVRQMLELIEGKMLDPDPKVRIRAYPLVNELEMFRKVCHRTPSFYMRSWKTSTL